MRKTRHVEGIFGASHTYIHNMNKHIDILVITGLYISGIEGAKEVTTLRQQGVSHILNMVGPGVYDHPLAGGIDKSYFPHLFK